MVLAQRHTGQWNRIENPELDPQLYGQLIFGKAEKNIQWKKVLGKLDISCRRIKLDHFLTPHTKIDTKQMKDLNVRRESIKILEKNTGSKLCDLYCSIFLLDTSPKGREIKGKMN